MSSDRISDLAVSVGELHAMIQPLASVPERMARLEEKVTTLTQTDTVLFEKFEKAMNGPDWRVLTPAIVTALAALAMLAERLAKHF